MYLSNFHTQLLLDLVHTIQSYHVSHCKYNPIKKKKLFFINYTKKNYLIVNYT